MVSRRDAVSVMARAMVGAGIASGRGDARPPAFARRAVRALADAASYAGDRPAGTLASDESYWATIRGAFDLDPRIIYLNNAGCSPTSRRVLDHMIRDLRYGNEAPVHYMWHVLEPRIETVRRELAAEFGCDVEEIAITRNASEANQIAILGLDLRPGDEVIVTTHNYDRMLTTWDQRADREGIVVRRVAFDVPLRADADAVDRIAGAITSRTRAIEVPQLTNWSGQPIDVAALVALAKARQIEVIVDGAQGFAHVPSRRDALGCDYYGASLHKWLLAPVGTGFLYVRRDRIARLWPLTPAPAAMRDNIRKFEEIGTHPAANHNAILGALLFHRGIGAERKLARLRFLRDRWALRLRSVSDRVHIPTPLDHPQSGALALIDVAGLDPVVLHDWLWTRYRIVTSPTRFAGLSGIRVSPNVFTSEADVDRFAEAVERAIKLGVRGG